MLKEYKTVSEIAGPLMLVEGVDEVKYGHIVDIELADGSMRHGQILQVEGGQSACAGVEGTEGINVEARRFVSWASRWNWRYRRIFSAGCSVGTGVPKDDGPQNSTQDETEY